MITRQRTFPVPALVVAAAMLLFVSGCRVVGGIFKAGVGVGVFLVVVAIAIVGGIAVMFSRK